MIIIFEFPDAVSPQEVGENDDSRLLALRIYNMKISEN